MPFINTITNKKISADDRAFLKAELGKMIDLVPGKSEKFLMLAFREADMYFGGEDNFDMVCVEVALYGSYQRKDYNYMTKSISKLYSERLGIPADKIYIKYQDCFQWGWNGENF